MKKTVFGFIVLILAGFLSISPINSIEAQVVVRVKPNRGRVVVAKPRAPQANMVWLSGEWAWNARQNRYTWQQGRWVQPRRGQAWKAGYWKRANGGHIWVPGRWVRRGRR